MDNQGKLKWLSESCSMETPLSTFVNASDEQIKEISLLRYGKYEPLGKGQTKRHKAMKHQAWVALEESATGFISWVFLGILGKTCRVGVCRRLVTLAATTEPKKSHPIHSLVYGYGNKWNWSWSVCFRHHWTAEWWTQQTQKNTQIYRVIMTTKTRWTLGCISISCDGS